MRWILELLRALLRHRPTHVVRPWALLAPALVLMVALPLLRPFYSIDPTLLSDDQVAMLATIRSVGERGTLAVNRADDLPDSKRLTVVHQADELHYADQPPAFAWVLGQWYRVLTWYGLTFATDPRRVLILLTLMGSTLPAAIAAVLVFRMGRLFELSRPRRAVLAWAAVFGTGLIGYATSLHSHAAAAMWLLGAAACLTHLAISQKKPVKPFWLFCAGLSAATAAITDPSAIVFLPLVGAACLGFRWPWLRRIAGLLTFGLGAVGPLAFHGALTMQSSGDYFQGIGFKPQTLHLSIEPVAPDAPVAEPDAAEPAGRMVQVISGVGAALLGRHGLLSHFPILLLGAAGVFMVMHRHWPTSSKVLAAGTLAGSMFMVVAYGVHRPQGAGWVDALFAARWFVAFSPLLLFWAGAWMRRPHRRWKWIVAGVALGFSVTTGLAGAATNWPRAGFEHHTGVEAWERWVGGVTALPATRESAPTGSGIAVVPRR